MVNTNTDTKSVNEVNIRGTIVHIYEAPKATIITVSTGRVRDVINYPKLILLGNTREQAKGFKVHDNITAVANIQSSRRQEGEKEFYTQALYVESIERSPMELEVDFGIKGSRYAPPKNVVKLSGEVFDIFTPRKYLIRVAIKTVKNNRISVVHTSFFTKNVGEVMEKIRVRDKVCGIGNIQTHKRDAGGKTVFMETVVLSDFQKIA
jgi:hypothetical protein